MNLKELKDLYIEALENYVEALKDADGLELEMMEKPAVMLYVENPQPEDGAEVDILPGLKGTVSHSVVEVTSEDKRVTSFVKVKCKDIERFLIKVGVKVRPIGEIIREKMGNRFH